MHKIVVVFFLWSLIFRLFSGEILNTKKQKIDYFFSIYDSKSIFENISDENILLAFKKFFPQLFVGTKVSFSKMKFFVNPIEKSLIDAEKNSHKKYPIQSYSSLKLKYEQSHKQYKIGDFVTIKLKKKEFSGIIKNFDNVYVYFRLGEKYKYTNIQIPERYSFMIDGLDQFIQQKRLVVNAKNNAYYQQEQIRLLKKYIEMNENLGAFLLKGNIWISPYEYILRLFSKRREKKLIGKALDINIAKELEKIPVNFKSDNNNNQENLFFYTKNMKKIDVIINSQIKIRNQNNFIDKYKKKKSEDLKTAKEREQKKLELKHIVEKIKLVEIENQSSLISVFINLAISLVLLIILILIFFKIPIIKKIFTKKDEYKNSNFFDKKNDEF